MTSTKSSSIVALPHVIGGRVALSEIIHSVVHGAMQELRELQTRLMETSPSERKGPMLKYIIHTRAQFIKLLVLVRWSVSFSSDIGKCIDVVAYMRGLQQHLTSAAYEIELSRQLLRDATVPAPPISLARHVLTVGELPQMTLQRFVDLLPVSPKTTLETLHLLSSIISLRLALHEIIPAELQVKQIKNGRCYISSIQWDGELSCSGLKSNWVLLKFTDRNIKNISNQRMKMLINTSNEILAKNKDSDPFVALYSHLENFLLSMRIEKLHADSLLILRSRKFKNVSQILTNVNYDSANRILVLNYWNNDGNYITIQMAKLDQNYLSEATLSKQTPATRLVVDWTCFGKLYSREPIETDSVNQILERFITRHINMIQSDLTKRLLATGFFNVHHVSDSKDSNSKILNVSFLGSKASLLLKICENTGEIQYIFNQTSGTIKDIQGFSEILAFRSEAIIEEISLVASQCEWIVSKECPVTAAMESLAYMRRHIFLTREPWAANNYLTIDLASLKAYALIDLFLNPVVIPVEHEGSSLIPINADFLFNNIGMILIEKTVLRLHNEFSAYNVNIKTQMKDHQKAICSINSNELGALWSYPNVFIVIQSGKNKKDQAMVKFAAKSKHKITPSTNGKLKEFKISNQFKYMIDFENSNIQFEFTGPLEKDIVSIFLQTWARLGLLFQLAKCLPKISASVLSMSEIGLEVKYSDEYSTSISPRADGKVDFLIQNNLNPHFRITSFLQGISGNIDELLFWLNFLKCSVGFFKILSKIDESEIATVFVHTPVNFALYSGSAAKKKMINLKVVKQDESLIAEIMPLSINLTKTKFQSIILGMDGTFIEKSKTMRVPASLTFDIVQKLLNMS